MRPFCVGDITGAGRFDALGRTPAAALADLAEAIHRTDICLAGFTTDDTVDRTAG